MSNPYKHGNYVEHNSALVPDKLINRNLVDASPVFEDSDDQSPYQKDNAQNQYFKIGGGGAHKLSKLKMEVNNNKDLIKHYQIYGKQTKNLSIDQKIPGLKDKLSLLQEEKRMFGMENGLEF